MAKVADFVRDVTVKALNTLKKIGIKEIIMLTGDNEGTARKVAAETGVDRYIAELLPEDKVITVKELQNERNIVAMVGDGMAYFMDCRTERYGRSFNRDIKQHAFNAHKVIIYKRICTF